MANAKMIFSRVFVSVTLLWSMPASAETLTSALAAAYNNSNLLAQNRALLRASDEDVAVALSALRPQVSASASATQTELSRTMGEQSDLSSTIAVSLSLLLYDGGSSKFAVEAAKEAVLAARAQLVDLEQTVLLNAVTAYTSVLRDTRSVSLRENNLRLITQELRAAKDRFEVGEVTRTDVAQAEARLAQARGELADAMGQLSISKELFVATVGRSPGALAPANLPSALPSTTDSARHLAERNSPLIAASQHQVKANELNVARAKAAKNPNVSLSANAGYSSSVQRNGSVGLSVTVPIYRGGQLSALERQAKATLHGSQSGLRQTVLSVRQNAADAWSRLAVAQAQLQASARQIRAAEVAFEGVREETRLGSRTTLDVLNAEQSLLDARTNQLIFETQVVQAAYALLAASGKLTASNLKLPVQQYDPAEYYNAVKSGPIARSKQGKQLDKILDRYKK